MNTVREVVSDLITKLREFGQILAVEAANDFQDGKAHLRVNVYTQGMNDLTTRLEGKTTSGRALAEAIEDARQWVSAVRGHLQEVENLRNEAATKGTEVYIPSVDRAWLENAAQECAHRVTRLVHATKAVESAEDLGKENTFNREGTHEDAAEIARRVEAQNEGPSSRRSLQPTNMPEVPSPPTNKPEVSEPPSDEDLERAAAEQIEDEDEDMEVEFDDETEIVDDKESKRVTRKTRKK